MHGQQNVKKNLSALSFTDRGLQRVKCAVCVFGTGQVVELKAQQQCCLLDPEGHKEHVQLDYLKI